MRTLSFAIVGLAALATGLAAAGPAEAGTQAKACKKRDQVLQHLSGKYEEAPVAIGVTSTGGLVEVLTSGEGGTWTIIVTSPAGLSCLMAAGDGWRQLDPAKVEVAGPEA